MTTLTASPVAARENRVLADRLGGTIAREIALVAAGTIAMIVLARISIPLPFTPVPVSLGTLGALSVGTTLGARRGLASVATYVILGIAGAPVFTGTNVGWAFPSFGYILGYLLVAAIAGLAAQRGADRRIATMAPTAVVSLFSVYILGLAWMIPFADGLQVLIDAGVKAVVQPGGSVRDQESIDAANAAGITMYLTGTRHFAH